MSDWQLVFVEPVKTIATQIGQFLINVILVLIILVIGWIISKILKSFVIKILKSIKLDDLAQRIELDDLLAKGGIPYSFSELIGIVVYWLGILITFVVAVNSIGLTVAADLLNRVVLYIPNIIAAIFILVLGMFIATMLKNIIQTAASNAGVAQAKILAKVVEVVVVIFAVTIALEQLGIATRIIELMISIVLASLGLGFSLAFGFGCQDLAKKFMGDLIEKMKSKK
jgi:hypothetical protein